MTLIYLVIWLFVLAAGASSIAALTWGIQNHQLRATTEDAASIFALDDSLCIKQPGKPRSFTQGG